MLSHERIWAAIDTLASSRDLTPSGLAKRAGLDSTSFNKSKRFAADGRPRWPSTESLAKIMAATGMSLDEFLGLVEPRRDAVFRNLLEQSAGAPAGASHAGFSESSEQNAHPSPPPYEVLRSIPVVGMAQAGVGGFFDDAGFPAGEGWDQIDFPDANGLDDHAYALEISGDSMLPLYREGDRIIVSPTATIRKGDRVVVKTRAGEVMAKILIRRTSLLIVLGSVNPDHADRDIPTSDIEWMARIVWASQ